MENMKSSIKSGSTKEKSSGVGTMAGRSAIKPGVPLIPRNIQWSAKVRQLGKTWELYLFLLPAITHVIIFKYFPIYGLRIAFTDGFSVRSGRSAPEWNEFAHFVRFFNSAYFWIVIKNTFVIAFYELALWPAPLILALMINQVGNSRYRKTVQMVTYAPHFISTVVVVSMMLVFLSPRNGSVNTIIGFFGFEPVFFMGDPRWAKTLFVGTNLWQHAGYSAIIYLAALAGVDVSAKEAAYCDGANKLQIIRHVEVPWIAPTIVILFILRVGRLLEVGFEKIILMQNDMNLSALEIINTYVYRTGILQSQYDYATAVGLLKTIVNFALLVSANQLARRLGQESLW
jgi:putative aldouronate transport system permease protein